MPGQIDANVIILGLAGMRPLLAFGSFLILALVSTAAAADDWTALRLRGTVLQLVGGSWVPVHRADNVPDETVIRTLGNGYVDFVRGAETVSLAPDTQVQIFDKGGEKPFTTVKQAFGTVSVEAEVLNVQHFAVETPYLAAVVKGTRFTVTSNDNGAAVSVQRGHVEVDDLKTRTHTTISVGQNAAVGDGKKNPPGLEVSGQGDLPQVLDAAGNVVASVEDKAGSLLDDILHGNSKGNSGNGKGNGGGDGSGSEGHGGGLLNDLFSGGDDHSGDGDHSGGGDDDNSGSGGGDNSGHGGGDLNLGGIHLRLGYGLSTPPEADSLTLWI